MTALTSEYLRVIKYLPVRPCIIFQVVTLRHNVEERGDTFREL